MATLDWTVTRCCVLLRHVGVVLERGRSLVSKLFHVAAALTALPLSSVTRAARHGALISAVECCLLMLHIRTEKSLVCDRRTHTRAFEETRRAFIRTLAVEVGANPAVA